MSNAFFKFVGSFSAGIGNLDKYSEERKRFLSSGYVCPQCKETLMSPLGIANVNCYSANGEKVSLLTARLSGEFFECSKCKYRWKFRDISQTTTSKEREVLEIMETERIEENFGSDRKIIDNSKSSTKLTRRFSISKECSKTYSINYEQAQKCNSGVSIGINEAVSLKADLEEAIKHQYAITEGEKEVCSEEVVVEVPGFIKLVQIFQWKRIWQCGFFKLCDQDGEVVKIPFQVVVGVTFDQVQVDEKN